MEERSHFSGARIQYGFSVLKDGPMGLSKNLNLKNARNRQEFVQKALGADPFNTVTTGLVHGVRIAEVFKSDAGSIIPDCDGLITRTADLPLLITFQDCVPVFLYDRAATISGCFHAGWRGIINNILPLAVKKVQKLYGIYPEDLCFVFGPAIQQCHFEVKEDVTGLFKDYPFCMNISQGRIFIDLCEVLLTQALFSGVARPSIVINGECTYCAKDERGLLKYFSRRREHIRENSMAAVIVMKSV